MTEYLDVAAFDYDASLGVDRRAFIVLKGFNQLAIVKKIVERKGNKTFGLTAVTNVTERRYSQGLVAFASLGTEAFDGDALAPRLECTEPFEVSVRGDDLAVTSGYRFLVFDLAAGACKEYTTDWMSYLHTIEFSRDGRRVLVAATGLDTILEIDLASGAVVWEWNAWDHGINYVKLTGEYLTRNRDQARRLAEEHPGEEIRLIEDPRDLPREGIATHHSPMNLNGAHYGMAGRILATGFHRPDLFIIDPDGSHRTHDLGLVNPHSFRRYAAGYMVADTGTGRLLLLGDEFAATTVVDLSNLPADSAKKSGFGEWLQTASPLNEHGLFACVDALRDGVHIVDIAARRRRFITNPPEWTIQSVMDAPIRADQFPAGRAEL